MDSDTLLALAQRAEAGGDATLAEDARRDTGCTLVWRDPLIWEMPDGSRMRNWDFVALMKTRALAAQKESGGG